jgi:hypothetical protein
MGAGLAETGDVSGETCIFGRLVFRETPIFSHCSLNIAFFSRLFAWKRVSGDFLPYLPQPCMGAILYYFVFGVYSKKSISYAIVRTNSLVSLFGFTV